MDRTSCRKVGELSINILKYSAELLNNQILPNISAKHQGLFTFGVQALSFSPFNSLNANARMVIANESTAYSKIFRLVSKEKVLNYFPKLLTKLNLVNKTSLVNVDFSTFCGFETLAFGVQTHEGRAIPIWNNCITYPIKEIGSQNLFVISEIKKLGLSLGFYPRFVFDRGFWIPDMIKFFLEENITFYLRIKAGKSLEYEHNQSGKSDIKPAKALAKVRKDIQIKLYGSTARLIVSPPPPKKKGKLLKERWYILTNDFISTREEVLDTYKHRFEIEETFKDLKHVCDLKKFFIKKKLTFKILLMFACLAFWIACLLRNLTQLKNLIQVSKVSVNPKKKRSYFKIWWEEIQRIIRSKGIQLLIPDG